MELLKDKIDCIACTYHTESKKLSFTINGKAYTRKLNEKYFSNWPLQWVVVNGEKLQASLDNLEIYRSYD